MMAMGKYSIRDELPFLLGRIDASGIVRTRMQKKYRAAGRGDNIFDEALQIE